jgi:hypothetical protein
MRGWLSAAGNRVRSLEAWLLRPVGRDLAGLLRSPTARDPRLQAGVCERVKGHRPLSQLRSFRSECRDLLQRGRLVGAVHIQYTPPDDGGPSRSADLVAFWMSLRAVCRPITLAWLVTPVPGRSLTNDRRGRWPPWPCRRTSPRPAAPATGARGSGTCRPRGSPRPRWRRRRLRRAPHRGSAPCRRR